MGGAKEDSLSKLLVVRRLVGSKQQYGIKTLVKTMVCKKKLPNLKKLLRVFFPTWKRLCNVFELRYGNFILTCTVRSAIGR